MSQQTTRGPRVKPIRINAQIRRGLTLVVAVIVKDFNEGFDEIFGEATEAERIDLTTALEWLEQFTNEFFK